MLTCRDAFATIFFRRDLRQADTVSYNCFPDKYRRNNSASVILDPSHHVYVDFHAEEVNDPHQPWQSLWLVFDIVDGKPRLAEIMAEYWGI